MTDKPADHEPSQEARAADTPPAPEARSAEGGTLPLPTEPLPAEESTPLPADEPTPLRTDEPTALSADEPTGHRPAEPVAAHTDADADGTVALEGASGAAESDTAAADPQSTALHSETRDYAADDVTKISAPTSAGEPPTEPLGAAGSTGPVDPAAADSPDEAPTSEFGTVPPPSEFGAAPPTSEFGAAPPFGAPGGTGGPPPPPPGGYQPPSGGFPPPPPPPTGGLFATRYGLVRPQNGRWFAGVCAAIGRATNTDPVLWRVLLAVLALFGGVGVLIYAVGWLLIPAEGDSASPAEALIGRGQSSTSALFTLGLAVLAVIMFGVAFSGNIRTGLLGAVVVVGAVLLVSKGKQAGTHGAPPPPTPTPPPPAFTPAASTASNPMNPTSTEPAGGYRPPFAPHGPYASSSPYPGYSPPYPGLDAPVAPPPKEPRRPRERSRLGRVVLSLICLAIGVLVVVDVAVASIAGTAYVAAALGVIGLGLVVGAWVGRARWLILPGLILTAILLLGSSVETWNSTHHGARNITWVPTTVSEIEQNGSYSIDVGNATLDLSKVDFTDHDVAVNTNLDAGNMTVILPPNVDVDVDANVEAGSASVLGQRWDGINHDARHIADQGADGAGGGKLRLNSSVNLGKLEVHR